MSEEEQPLSVSVRENLRTITNPLREQMEKIEARQTELRRELRELTAARQQIKTVVDKLEPQAPAKANSFQAKITEKGMEAKTKRVLGYLEKRNGDAFTGTGLSEELKEAGVFERISPEMTRNIVAVLHARGVLRIDHVVKGGGNAYVVVGPQQGSEK